MRPWIVAASSALVLLACVAPKEPAPERAPQRDAAPWRDWQSERGRDHPLAGRIWDARARAFVAPAEVASRARASRFALLGEKHDNGDHHRIQAWIVSELAGADRHRAVAFEMIPRDRREALAAVRRERPRDVDAIADAVAWAESGWPAWSLYRPVFAAAVGAGLDVVPGDLARARLRDVSRAGLAALGEAEAERLGLAAPLGDAGRRALVDEIRDAHCGFLPESQLEKMVDVQRARDAALADALLDAAGRAGAVLIAGTGHVRRDRGVPLYLGRRAPHASVLALALIEVVDAEAVPSAYAGATGGPAFDLIWFTPRVDDEDPCEAFRDQLEQLRRAPAPAARGKPADRLPAL